MLRHFTFIILLSWMLLSCTRISKNLSVEIVHYAGGPGITLIYNLDQDGVQVATNCDLENCKQKTVYERAFTKNERESILKHITSLRLDTLQSSYRPKRMVLDGLFTTLTVKQGIIYRHRTTFDNISTPVTDSLYNYIDGLILVKKYRFNSWGKD